MSRALSFGLSLMLGIGTAGVAYAQGASDVAGGDHAGRHHGRMVRLLDGPPAPAFMRDSLKVSGKELQQYTHRYDTHMAATKALRDSVRSGVRTAHAAYEKGGSEARSGREKIQQQWKTLAEQDKNFEDSLKSVLTKDQQARYQQWKDKRKQEVQDHWRQHRAEARQGWHMHHDSTNASRTPADSGSKQPK
jgi:Spy/CpxP family protein refolding chaperone